MDKAKEIADLKARIARLEAADELIQGLTRDQWQQVIDGGFLCEFGVHGGDFRLIGRLTEIVSGPRVFKDQDGDALKYCRPLRMKGVKQPWFGGECPVEPDTEVFVYMRDAGGGEYPARSLRWSHSGSDGDIIAFIEL